MRVLVCGGRDFNDWTFLDRVLIAVHAKRPITTVIEGGARGADSMGRAWAERRGIAVSTFPADWELYGKRAGSVRNLKMLREGRPDLVVAFPGGRGTSHMVRSAREADVRVLEAGNYKD